MSSLFPSKRLCNFVLGDLGLATLTEASMASAQSVVGMSIFIRKTKKQKRFVESL